MLPFESQVVEIYEDLHRIAPGALEQFQSLPSANQYRRLYELTSAHVPSGPGVTVLDWGCGRGHFTYYLLRRGYRVTAYSLEDPPELFARLPAAERERLTFVRGEDPAGLPFADGSFDAVFSVGVLEHVRELGGTEIESLQEIRRVLRPGGVLVVYHLPNRFSPIEAVARMRHRRHDPREGFKFHQYRFTAAEISRLSKAAGLQLRAMGRYGFLPRNSLSRLPASARSSRRVASWINVADFALERVFSPFTQNYFFVAAR
ncbi:MAG TPA: class I SAM-dependent methyltransferase [Thermoanaerobaculia bacterium]